MLWVLCGEWCWFKCGHWDLPWGVAWQGLGPVWPRLPLPTGPHVGGTLSRNQEACQVQGPYLLDINTDVDVNQLGAWWGAWCPWWDLGRGSVFRRCWSQHTGWNPGSTLAFPPLLLGSFLIRLGVSPVLRKTPVVQFSFSAGEWSSHKQPWPHACCWCVSRPHSSPCWPWHAFSIWQPHRHPPQSLRKSTRFPLQTTVCRGGVLVLPELSLLTRWHWD